MRARLVLFAVLGILSITFLAQRMRERRDPHVGGPAVEFADPAPIRGTLRFAFVPRAGKAATSTAKFPAATALSSFPEAATPGRRLRSVFVNGTTYSGMEDNDLRGFLDGVFKYAWNQPTQVHVRIGRRDKGPRYGEFEIFRVLQRWSGVLLPPGARVERASLRLHVEQGPPDSVRLFLYEVRKDWDPGQGGVLQNNVSPPAPGEVWWNDVAYAESSWALPGVGFASDMNPRADTGAMPLAEASWSPGASEVTFESWRLAEYATRRATAGLPLLFLLKVSDPLEDTPGTVLTVFSGNTGDSRNVSRRPLLALEWIAPAGASIRDHPVHLEHGRTLTLPSALIGLGTMYATFLAEDGSLDPTIEARTGRAPRGDAPAETTAWARGSRWEVDADWAQVRVLAAVDPISIGEMFRAELRDTWIRTAAPEDQRVPWVFVAPSGTRHEMLAHYAGDSRWTVEFTPDELGSWSYSWEQDFAEHHFASGEAVFDVIGGSLSGVIGALDRLASESMATDRKDHEAAERLMARFARLERAAMAEITPEEFAGAVGESTRAALRRVREALGREAVPDSLPMLPDGPPEWKKKANGK